MKHNWLIKKYDETAARRLAGDLNIHPITAGILAARNITRTAEAFSFLNPSLSQAMSPFLMKGMRQAVERIRRALEGDETIGIFSDSDLDGLTSLTLMTKMLKGLRKKEGREIICRYPVNAEQYGLTEGVIDEFKAAGVSLLITLDCGTRDVAEIACARTKGIDTIVCDHHEPDLELPDAIMVNPKQKDCTYPYRDLAGVGVAFKLCHALLMSYHREFDSRFVLLSFGNDRYHRINFVNGISDTWISSSSLQELLPGVSAGDNVILHNVSADGALEADRKSGCRVFNFSKELNAIVAKVSKGIVASLDYGELMVYAFNELWFSNQAKVRDRLWQYCTFVALGSVADIVPADGENRILISCGLRSMEQTAHPGLSMLIERINQAKKVQKGGINTRRIGWDIAPLLNAPGRMGKSQLTAEFLLEENGACVESLIGEIENENAKRKEQLQEHFEAVKREIEKQGEEAPTYDNRLIWMGKNLIIAQLRDLEDGIVGLLANRLADYYGLPVIVVSLGGQDASPGTVKGSGRVRDSFNFFSCLEPLAGMFEKIGGHQQAFGFTARAALLPDIFRTLTSNIPDDSTGEKNHEIDAEVRLHEIQLGLVEELSRLEPHGNRNEEPIFLSRSVQVRKFDALGAGRKHAKLTVEDGATIEAIAWNMYGRIRSVLGLEEAQVEGFLYPRLDLVFRVEINDYNGSRKPRIVLVDFDRSDASELR